MYKYTQGLLAGVLIFAAATCLMAAEQGKAGKKDRKQMQGTWTAKKGQLSAVLTIKGKKFTFKMNTGDKVATAFGTIKIDPSKEPKTIDMKLTKGKGEEVQKYVGKTSLGIYKLKKDTLTWCASEPGGTERPKAFDADTGGHLMLIFQRKKD